MCKVKGKNQANLNQVILQVRVMILQIHQIAQVAKVMIQEKKQEERSQKAKR